MKTRVQTVGSAALVATLPLAVALSSCSSDTAGDTAPTTQAPGASAADSEFAIKLYVGGPGQEHRIDLGPIPRLSARAEDEAMPWDGGAMAGEGPGLAPNAVVGTPDGSITIDQEDLSTGNGWALAGGALAECGYRPALMPPWQNHPGSFGFFSVFPFNCGVVSAYQEYLVCAADKLNQVAEATQELYWPGTDSMSGNLKGPWRIPPQRAVDRFIARDLAIYMLANVAWLDMVKFDDPRDADTSASTTCTDLLGAAATQTGADQWVTLGNTSVFGCVWGGTCGPQQRSVTDAASLRKYAVETLSLNSFTLRQSGRMLKALIESSVQADMAGAEQRRARAGDPAAGARMYWGMADPVAGADGNGDEPYNSIAHAIRVLSGRWEMGPAGLDGLGGPEPACSGVGSLELVSKAYGNDLTARYASREITTAGQERAIALVESAGIVVPSSAFNGTTFSTVREKILAQMLYREAVQLGIPADDQQFRNDGKGKSLAERFAEVPDTDLRFALSIALDNFRLLTGASEDLSDLRVGGIETAFAPDNEVTEYFRNQGWLVLKSGLHRMDVTADFIARAGGIQESSQCISKQGATGYLNPDANYGGVRMAFQDAFSLGQSIERRLIRVRQRLSEAGIATNEKNNAAAAAAEVGSWTGPGRIIAAPANWTDLATATIKLYTLGFDPADWAVSTAGQMSQELVLVYGEPLVADCVARLRSACPSQSTLEQAIVRPKTNPAPVVLAPPSRGLNADYEEKRKLYSFDGSYGEFEFARDPVLSALELSGATAPGPKHLYAVLLHDPEAPSVKGKVLGALALRVDGDSTQLIVSDLQRKLINDVLGIDKGWGTSGPRLAAPGLSLAKGYCLPDVPRNMFVPLENELTSDSDGYESSWKHYLQLARQAAARADELGQKLIDVGLQQDYRREAAQEELAAVCGGYGALDDVVVANGNVTPANNSKDEGLNSCLEEDKTDIVFLTEDQSLVQSDKTPSAFLTENVLRCSEYPNPICDEPEITSGGLGIVKSRHQPPAAQTCEPVFALVGSLKTNLNGDLMQQLGVSPWLQADSVAALVRSLRIESVGPASGADWVVYFGGEIIMDSRADQSGGDTGVDTGTGGAGGTGGTGGSGGAGGSGSSPAVAPKWPGCLKTGLCDFKDRRISLFNQLYNNGVDAGVTTDSQVMILRWRVEGSMWTLASLSGTIPGGMFSSRIPAVNFGPGGATSDAPVLTIYGGSVFAKDLTAEPQEQYVLQFESSQDQAILGPAHKIPATHDYATSDEVPEWLSVVYLQNKNYPDMYYAVDGTSAEMDLGLPPEFSVSQAVYDIGDKLGGLKCADAHSGSGSGTPVDPVEGNRLVAALKGLHGSPGTRLRLSQKGDRGAAIELASDETGEVDIVLRDIAHKLPNCDYSNGHCGTAQQLIPLFPYANDGNLYSCCGVPNALQMNEEYRQRLTAAEIKDEGTGSSEWEYRWRRRVLLPQVTKPADRVAAFVNSYAPRGACGAAYQMVNAMALACALSSGELLPPPVAPPTIRSLNDLPYFTRWIDYQANRASVVVSQLYLEKVPDRVVKDLSAGRVGSGDTSGEHGQLVIQMGTALRGIVDGWAKVEGDLRMLKTAVDNAQNQIAAADIRQNEKLKEYAIRKSQTHAAIAAAVAGVISASAPGMSVGSSPNPKGKGMIETWSYSFNPVGAAEQAYAAQQSIAASTEQLSALDDLDELAGEEKANQIVQVFINLQGSAEPVYQDLPASLTNIQNSVASFQQLSSQLRQAEAKAKYQAAKGLGEDYAVIDGKVVEYPVNTVLRREYDITRRRYEAALADAKYLAYVARLAIEQRIGMRLLTINDKVGPLEAPSLWADDVCNLQGIDYRKLRSFLDGGADSAPSEEAEDETIAEFADQYIGDYVAKLENFVEYFNIQYPSHDGDDMAILSLRDDLLAGGDSCVTTSPNLLLNSGDLSKSDSWQVNACEGTARCLRVIDAHGLPALSSEPLDANKPPSTHAGGGLTWLLETPVAYGPGSDAGISSPPTQIDAGANSSSGEPPRTVWQNVWLDPGSYLLSWWDQARDENGEPAAEPEASTLPTLTVGVYREDWHVHDVRPFTPYVVPCLGQAGCAAPWSDKPQSMKVAISQPGMYHIAFSISRITEQAGSVAIANVQLEVGTGAEPSAYVGNGSSRLQVVANCPKPSAGDLQSAFTYRCEGEAGCFYELKQPILLDTGTGDPASSNPRNARFADGNFNYRHITAAVNLVGTGLRDCSGTGSASCYGSGYLEYSLVHDAFDVGVLGWDNRTQRFNFGSASINHGKALAAERFITLPLSSADQGLLNQAGIEKPEFTGRPIDGSYRLRIWDTPGLTWNRLEDVQLILKYRYWSAIQKQQGSL